jgi:hypothetical protein
MIKFGMSFQNLLGQGLHLIQCYRPGLARVGDDTWRDQQNQLAFDLPPEVRLPTVT